MPVDIDAARKLLEGVTPGAARQLVPVLLDLVDSLTAERDHLHRIINEVWIRDLKACERSTSSDLSDAIDALAASGKEATCR